MDPSFVWSFSSDEEVDEGSPDAVLPPLLQMLEMRDSVVSVPRRLAIGRRQTNQYDDSEPMFEV